MAVELSKAKLAGARTVHLVTEGHLERAGLGKKIVAWAKANDFSGKRGQILVVPNTDGSAAGALLGTGKSKDTFAPLLTGQLARRLPEGDWAFASPPENGELAFLGLLLGGYAFTRYGKQEHRALRFAVPGGVDAAQVRRLADGVFLTRDLINTPANDMGPEALERAARSLANAHKAKITVVSGDDLLTKNFPMIHAVGRAAVEAPRLIDMHWGPKAAPKVTLVGKGVSFDTGGLDIKPASSMLLMKKDMGGAANVLGLASIIMSAGHRVRLRVLIPAVENSISADSFRPGDVLKSRKGLSVEVGNTDAEGRLVLADALALADEEEPDLLIDMATLTGAARVALGPDLPPFYTDDDELAVELSAASQSVADPLWRMPLWQPYHSGLSSKIADLGNVTSGGFAGSITAALFLQRFVEKAKAWAHFDIYGWNPADRPHGTIGGEAQGIRALGKVIAARFS